MDLIALIASDEVLDAAFDWLCERRQHHHYNSDVWQVRRWWGEKKARLQAQLLAGSFRFRELRRFYGKERVTEFWASLDARSVEGGGDCFDAAFWATDFAEVFSFRGFWGDEGGGAGGGGAFSGKYVCVTHRCQGILCQYRPRDFVGDGAGGGAGWGGD